MKMSDEKCVIKPSWIKTTPDGFNDIAIGKIFRQKEDCIVVAHEDGVLRTYKIPEKDDGKKENLKSVLVLESKGGPIQAVVLHDVTRLGGKDGGGTQDVLVADARGTVTVFSNEQILSRRAVSQQCIPCLVVQQDKLGNQAILTGDMDGHVVAFSMYSDLWRLRLGDIPHLKGVGGKPAVTALHATTLCTRHGQRLDYVLAADTTAHLYLLQHGRIHARIPTPQVITAMSSGRFVEPQSLENGENNPAFDHQVALGTDSGAIYIFTNFQVYHEEYANVELPVTCLQTLPAADTQPTDSLLCAGNFNSLLLLRDGKMEGVYESGSWITSVVLAGTGKPMSAPTVLIGCQDKSIHALNITFS